MKFSTIINILYNNVSNGKSKQAFTQELLINCVGDKKDDNPVLDTEPKTFNAYFSGKRDIQPLIKRIGNQFDSQKLLYYLQDLFGGNDELIERTYNDFSKLTKAGLNVKKDTLEQDIQKLLIYSFFGDNVKDNDKSILVPVDLEDLYNADLLDLNSFFDTSNKKLKLVNQIVEEKLPQELKEDFRVVEKYNQGEMKFSLEPKTKDAYKKYPRNYVVTFQEPPKKDFREYLNKANRTDSMVAVGTVAKIEEFLGNFKNPFPDDIPQKGILCIGPVQNPKKITVDVILHNPVLSFNLKNQVLLLLEEGEGYFVFSNQRNINEEYKFEIIVDVTNSSQTKFNMIYEPREKYKNDIKVLYEYAKFNNIVKDKKATMILKSVSSNFHYNLYTLNNISYKKEDYTEMRKVFKTLEEIIDIENLFDFKFKTELDKVVFFPHLIKIAHNSLIDKKKIIKMKCQIPVCCPKGDYDSINIGDGIEGEVDFSKVKIFDKEIELTDAIVEIENGKVVDKQIIDNEEMLKVDITGFKIVKE